MGIITVDEFEKAVEVFGFNHPVVTAIWNTMYKNEDNENEVETIYQRWSAGQYKEG